jgi:hypothetical protein
MNGSMLPCEPRAGRALLLLGSTVAMLAVPTASAVAADRSSGRTATGLAKGTFAISISGRGRGGEKQSGSRASEGKERSLHG